MKRRVSTSHTPASGSCHRRSIASTVTSTASHTVWSTRSALAARRTAAAPRRRRRAGTASRPDCRTRPSARRVAGEVGAALFRQHAPRHLVRRPQARAVGEDPFRHEPHRILEHRIARLPRTRRQRPRSTGLGSTRSDSRSCGRRRRARATTSSPRPPWRGRHGHAAQQRERGPSRRVRPGSRAADSMRGSTRGGLTDRLPAVDGCIPKRLGGQLEHKAGVRARLEVDPHGAGAVVPVHGPRDRPPYVEPVGGELHMPSVRWRGPSAANRPGRATRAARRPTRARRPRAPRARASCGARRPGTPWPRCTRRGCRRSTTGCAIRACRRRTGHPTRTVCRSAARRRRPHRRASRRSRDPSPNAGSTARRCRRRGPTTAPRSPSASNA